MSLITCAMLGARRTFKAVTFAGDLGAALKAEADYEVSEHQLLGMFEVVVLRPDEQPFTDEGADGAIACCRRWIDRRIENEREEDGLSLRLL